MEVSFRRVWRCSVSELFVRSLREISEHPLTGFLQQRGVSAQERKSATVSAVAAASM
jgi:hypothetical protein